MDTDMKWITLLFMIIIGVPILGMGLERYQTHRCRIEAIHANYDAEKIAQVCR